MSIEDQINAIGIEREESARFTPFGMWLSKELISYRKVALRTGVEEKLVADIAWGRVAATDLTISALNKRLGMPARVVKSLRMPSDTPNSP